MDGPPAGSLHRLREEAHRLTPQPAAGASGPPSLRIEPCRRADRRRQGSLLVRYAGPPSGWALVTEGAARVRVNGVPVAIGLAVLRDRDEVVLEGAAPFYLSTERVPQVVAYADADRPKCARCTRSIEPGDACVRCPGCDVVQHEGADRACWTYAATCAVCDQASALSEALRWSPGDL